jgi:hypothetical protein
MRKPEEEDIEGEDRDRLLLSREMGTSMAEVARRLRVGISAIAMAIRRRNPVGQRLG